MISHDEMLDNVAIYALGALPPAEAAAVAAHLQTCAECRREYELLRPAVTAAGASAQADAGASPSPLLKARLMREVRDQTRTIRRTPMWGVYLAAAACVAFAIGAVLTNLSLHNRQAQQSALISDLTAANAKHYRFAGGEVVVHDGRLYIAMHALPPPPAGKVYQAWTLPKGSHRMTPEQTFMPSGSGPTIVEVPVSSATVAAVAVSVEPLGGSKQPTSKPIALAVL
jgi:anti-sigma-K factor RskA